VLLACVGLHQMNPARGPTIGRCSAADACLSPARGLRRSGAPSALGYSKEVAGQDSMDVGAGPTAPAEVLAEREQGLGGHPLDRSPSGVAVVKHVRVASECSFSSQSSHLLDRSRLRVS
jgi:hypothetical protein